jgi:hypothetical protein
MCLAIQQIERPEHLIFGSLGPQNMVTHCYNSACRKELHYLREGRVVRILHGDGEDARVEHFWLCGTCSEHFEFVFTPDGSVALGSRSKPRCSLDLDVQDDLLLEWPIGSTE